MGRTFVTVFLQNDNLDLPDTQSLELFINTYSPLTTVTFSIDNVLFLNNLIEEAPSSFTIPIVLDLKLSGVAISKNVILIESDKDICVTSIIKNGLSSETSIVYPLNEFGLEYYIVTGAGLEGGKSEFAVISGEKITTVNIYLKGAVNYKGVNYGPQKVLTVTLPAFSAIQIQSTEDLTGTRIVSQKPVAVLSGSACVGIKCSLVFEQLTPVSSWGKDFIVTPAPKTEYNAAFVVASQRTTVQYYSDPNLKKLLTLAAGEFLKIVIGPQNTVNISASAGIEVLFYGRAAQKQLGHIFLEVPPVSKYCYSYSQPPLIASLNFVVLIVRTADVQQILFNNGQLTNVKWVRYPGTDYSLTTKQVGPIQPGSLFTCSSPFLLLSYGALITDTLAYGSVGICAEGKFAYLFLSFTIQM